jgi:hypothetical protein
MGSSKSAYDAATGVAGVSVASDDAESAGLVASAAAAPMIVAVRRFIAVSIRSAGDELNARGLPFDPGAIDMGNGRRRQLFVKIDFAASQLWTVAVLHDFFGDIT